MIDYLLDFFRIDILSRWSENHVVESSFDIVPPLGVNGGKVICPEPSVIGEHGSCPFRVLVVTEHDIVTLGYYFTFSSLRIDIVKPYLYVICRHTDRTYFGFADAGVAD